jgi:hypothetical protein
VAPKEEFIGPQRPLGYSYAVTFPALNLDRCLPPGLTGYGNREIAPSCSPGILKIDDAGTRSQASQHSGNVLLSGVHRSGDVATADLFDRRAKY